MLEMWGRSRALPREHDLLEPDLAAIVGIALDPSQQRLETFLPLIGSPGREGAVWHREPPGISRSHRREHGLGLIHSCQPTGLMGQGSCDFIAPTDRRSVTCRKLSMGTRWSKSPSQRSGLGVRSHGL